MAAAEDRPIGYRPPERKEDPRFVRGQGNYVDDVELPGMLHGAMLRSPLAHARIVSIDTSAALQHPKVHAVITGKDLEGLKLAWMPTLSADVQAVLATDKVRFQGQEVAFVVADDRYSARDALELIHVEYDALPPVVDARKALDAGRARDPRRHRGQDGQPHLRLGGGRQGRHRRRVRRGRRRGQPRTWSTRASTRRRWRPAAPSPTSTPSTGKLTLWMTTQAPHAHRTALRDRRGPAGAQDPGHLPRHRRRLRQQGRRSIPATSARSSARSSPASRSSGWRTAPRT